MMTLMTTQVSILAEPVGGDAGNLLQYNLNTVVALLQELDVNLDERWLVALWDFWSDLQVREHLWRVTSKSAPRGRDLWSDSK
jgi:hypothetical protein